MYKCILYMLMLQPEIWDWSIYCKIEDDLLGGFTLTIFGIRDMDGYCFFSKAIPFTIIWNTIGQFDNPIYT